ncbi:MAG: hypothetical protein MZV64_36995 [Ignavibacteriales bacterium]|nr:hypothetical protein [Ignavibacteriales bacterium]
MPSWVTTIVSPPSPDSMSPGERAAKSPPRVVMFSPKSPGVISRPVFRANASMLSLSSRLTCRCQFPAWASPSRPSRAHCGPGNRVLLRFPSQGIR